MGELCLRYFKIINDVRQGNILSAKLVSVYVVDHLKRNIITCKVRYVIDDKYVDDVMYVTDLNFIIVPRF